MIAGGGLVAMVPDVSRDVRRLSAWRSCSCVSFDLFRESKDMYKDPPQNISYNVHGVRKVEPLRLYTLWETKSCLLVFAIMDLFLQNERIEESLAGELKGKM